MEVLQIVERVGAYAGFAAVIGLAVLSALYFSQARDLRRLREWAGRAPERLGPTRTARPGVRPATAAPRPVAAGGEGSAAAGARANQGAAEDATAAPAAGAAAATASGGAGTAVAAPRPAPARGGTSPAGAFPAGRGPARPGAPPLRGRPAAASPVNAPAERRGFGWRYVALVVVGILVVGGGIAFAVVEYTRAPPAPEPAAAPPGSGRIVPSAVTVSVLNGTTTPGLAAQVGDKVESGGFRLGNVTNASEQQRAESVVLYAGGAGNEARAVARELDIEQTERAENGERVLAGTARVIVVVGADMAAD